MMKKYTYKCINKGCNKIIFESSKIPKDPLPLECFDCREKFVNQMMERINERIDPYKIMKNSNNN